ncbi:MAG TPA: hypothetical protein VJ728_12915 [Candidatus Binataceae bacterium]|nr:hypothetical protein [Candidatus Binataceae bacterium]
MKIPGKAPLSRIVMVTISVFAIVGLFGVPAQARFGGGFGGGFGRAGGGFRMGGDGFAGGNPSHTAWSQGSPSHYGSSYSNYHPSYNYNSYHPSYSSSTSGYRPPNTSGYEVNSANLESAHTTNQTARFNEANSLNQSRYSEAQSMQNKSYQNQSALSQQHYNQASNLESNSNGNWHDPYGGCCGSSGGSEAGAAAVGMMGGMAMGATMESAMQPRQPTTIVENVAPPPTAYGAPLPYLPPGATPARVNGMDHYVSNGTYYKPVFNGSQVVYVASPM